MEVIRQILQDSVNGGFCQFMGYVILLGLPILLVAFLVNRPLRHWNIRKHGYPPVHCDADGDLRDEDDY